MRSGILINDRALAATKHALRTRLTRSIGRAVGSMLPNIKQRTNADVLRSVIENLATALRY